jgi:FixJ family two-component response regulator
VILDVHMPGLSGLDVQARLQEAGIHVPIVFITADEHLVISPNASEGGAVRLLRKPFSNTELLDAIGAALRKSPSAFPQTATQV